MPGERTEQATPHRREKARKEGDILHSREFSAAAGTLAGVMALAMMGTKTLLGWRQTFASFLDLGNPVRWEPAQIGPTLVAMRRLMLGVFAGPALVMMAVAAAALGAGLLQTGGVSLHAQAIGFKPERINPAANLKNLFSLRAAARLGKSLIPAALLAVFALQRIGRQLTIPPFSTARLETLGSDVYGLLAAAAWLLFGWSAIDFLVEWQARESRLKMSKQDLRDEFKETEGSPQIRSRIRGLQRQMRRRKVKADVAKAAVVLTNPTHYAVALGFDFTTMDAPKVLAKGRNLLAEEIKAEARWAGVPIVENPPLARSLYRSVEVGKTIPVELYASDVKSIGNQISGILSEIMTLANTSYQGQYIFAGGQTSAAPFTPDAADGATYSGDTDINYLEMPNGRKIQLNVPGSQIFLGSGSSNVFATLNSLVADYSTGTVDMTKAAADTEALTAALGYVSQQRVTIDNSIAQLSTASNAVSNEKMQLTAAQTNLMQADIGQVSTQLALAETQQTALEDVIAQLGSASNSLFSKL